MAHHVALLQRFELIFIWFGQLALCLCIFLWLVHCVVCLCALSGDLSSLQAGMVLLRVILAVGCIMLMSCYYGWIIYASSIILSLIAHLLTWMLLFGLMAGHRSSGGILGLGWLHGEESEVLVVGVKG